VRFSHKDVEKYREREGNVKVDSKLCNKRVGGGDTRLDQSTSNTNRRFTFDSSPKYANDM